MRPLPPSYGRVSLSLLAGQTHVNLLGNIHGGEVMRLVDSAAGAAAGRHSGGAALTAAMDERPSSPRCTSATSSGPRRR